MSTNSLVKVLGFFLHFTRGSLEPSEVQKCLNLKSLGTNHLPVPVFCRSNNLQGTKEHIGCEL